MLYITISSRLTNLSLKFLVSFSDFRFPSKEAEQGHNLPCISDHQQEYEKSGHWLQSAMFAWW